MKNKNKKKIFNDPVYGFISIPNDFIFDLIEHPYMQRLRRIRQLGMSHLVYPGALHTRFHHVLGAMHLMNLAVQVIRRKGHEITEKEEQAVLAAILLHDIGHGPFSHALEHDIVNGVSHEDISGFFMQRLEHEFGDKLRLTREIFTNQYHKPFLYQLVSSQLDMDRMDYLNRDSFYTGVSEGVIGSDRIIEMLDVHEGNLVLEEKGIYSVEKFITARRLMYWQVYLHKTVVSAEHLLINTLKRAKQVSLEGKELFASPALAYFLKNNITRSDFEADPSTLDTFALLDDYDIMGAIKVWQFCDDKILSDLSKRLINRKLFKIKISKEPFSEAELSTKRQEIAAKLGISEEETVYYLHSSRLVNNAYNQEKQTINLLMKNGEIINLTDASDNLNISALTKPVEKFFICYPS
ncbi:HD domain-containing protein [Crocinitomicaceae bacterium CZZ-1]|uniref:HD domain-containing protein n=1 Tax=Taishania pollutisoli TaxID=2766479 RepID=A0A8J6P4L6_9FLAO|nr:HD domain-containing protein [Taishania pollutisoli]MBC9811509.1 HD domain-containing protein [Taishania pollutisoli]